MSRTALAFTAALTLSTAAFAQGQGAPPVGPDFSKVEVKTTDLGHRTYMLEGFGGNVTVAVGDDGVIIVDTEFAPMHDKLKAAVAAITPQPIRYVDQHPPPRRPHRRQRGRLPRTAPPSWRMRMCGSGSPPAPRTTSPASPRRRPRPTCCRRKPTPTR